MNLLFICKVIKFQPFWEAFMQRNQNHNQRSHGSTYLTSLMNVFKVSRFCQQNAFGHQILSSSVSKWANPSWTHWHFVVKHSLCLVHTLTNAFHFYSMTLKHILKILMPTLEIRTKNAHLVSRCDLFVKDHVQLQYVH
jgi:hypothetical protein